MDVGVRDVIGEVASERIEIGREEGRGYEADHGGMGEASHYPAVKAHEEHMNDEQMKTDVDYQSIFDDDEAIRGAASEELIHEEGWRAFGAMSENIYWPPLAINVRLREWLRKRPMQHWSINDHAGRSSCEKFSIESNTRHNREPPMEAEMFQTMGETMLIAKKGMDETFQGKEEVPGRIRRMEWCHLKAMVFSICDDCAPELAQQRPADQPVTTTYEYDDLENPIPNTSDHKGVLNTQEVRHVEEVHDDHVVPNHGDNQFASKRKFKDASARGERPNRSNSCKHRPRDTRTLEGAPTPRDGSCIAEEVHHDPGDHDDFVGCTGRARTTPRKAEVDERAWKYQGQTYHVQGRSAGETKLDGKGVGQIGCSLGRAAETHDQA